MMTRRYILPAALLGAAATLLLAGCIRPYKIDIQQGNTVTNEQLVQLEPGMSRRDVQFIMGSPMVEDPFHNDRWVYYYSFRPGGSRTRDQQALTLVFDDDRLSHVEGDGELEVVDAKTLELLSPEEAEKQGFFSRLFKRGSTPSTSE